MMPTAKGNQLEWMFRMPEAASERKRASGVSPGKRASKSCQSLSPNASAVWVESLYRVESASQMRCSSPLRRAMISCVFF